MATDRVDAADSDSGVGDDTNELLRGILKELKSIGGQLRQQDERLSVVELKIDEKDVSQDNSIAQSPTATQAITEIQSASHRVISTDQARYIYDNDLVGSEQLAKEDGDIPMEPIRELTSEEIKIWTELVGDIWRLPEDGRLPFMFQKRYLLRLWMPLDSWVSTDPNIAVTYLRDLVRDDDTVPPWTTLRSKLSRSNISITDYFDDQSMSMQYDVGTKVPEAFFKLLKVGDGKTLATDVTSCNFAPWRRIICLRGLEFRNIPLIHFGKRPVRIGRTIEDYKNCSRRPRDELYTGYMKFHITFYKIQPPEPTQVVADDLSVPTWKRGYLHSSEDYLCECAYTALFVPGWGQHLEGSRNYWTLLELRPASFPGLTSSTATALREAIDVLHATIVVTSKVLTTVAFYWQQILDYFETFIGEKDTFLDPERHDSLLSDDETFSRSKKYFWAITTLRELNLSISDNLFQIQKLLDLKIPAWMDHSPGTPFEAAQSTLRDQCREIEEIAIKLREKRQEAVDLRDGLFSASAVIESRAATRLGENVRLLTFVSIFFLPLSFCMSIWSINNLFSVTSLALVTPLLALATYLTVFNLDALVRLYQDAFRTLISATIKSMKNDNNEIWRDRGKAFEKISSPKRVGSKPSDWRLIQYAFRKFLWPSTLAEIKRTDNEQGGLTRPEALPDKHGPNAQASENPQLYSSLKFWRRRKTGSQDRPAV